MEETRRATVKKNTSALHCIALHCKYSRRTHGASCKMLNFSAGCYNEGDERWESVCVTLRLPIGTKAANKCSDALQFQANCTVSHYLVHHYCYHISLPAHDVQMCVLRTVTTSTTLFAHGTALPMRRPGGGRRKLHEKRYDSIILFFKVKSAKQHTSSTC